MYHVNWSKSVREELASAWIESESTRREAITTAAAKIDEILQSAPSEFGESRTANRRIAFVPPLGLAFSVDEIRQRAKVLHVWPI